MYMPNSNVTTQQLILSANHTSRCQVSMCSNCTLNLIRRIYGVVITYKEPWFSFDGPTLSIGRGAIYRLNRKSKLGRWTSLSVKLAIVSMIRSVRIFRCLSAAMVLRGNSIVCPETDRLSTEEGKTRETCSWFMEIPGIHR